MAISAGNYIIRSAIDEDIVLLTSGGSKSSGAFIAAGALTEADNRCYWKCSVVSSSYNRFYNLKTGQTNGNIMVKNVTGGVSATQGAYKIATGGWLAVASGNTMTVNGASVSTYYLKAYSDQDLFLTIPDEGGALYLSPELDDTTPQEFYFEATTYVNTKLATPSALTAADGRNYIISSTGAANAIYPQWKSSSTAVIYEMRSRTRRYDMDGIAEEWGAWTAWTMTSAAKASSGIMRSATSVSAPAVDNSTYSQADIQIEVRLTSAKNTSAYNKTGTVTHGNSVSGLIQKWKQPTLSVSAAECTKDGLKVSYASDYTIAGNMLRFVSIMNGAEELVANYILTNQDYQGGVIVAWDALSSIPDENDSLDITLQLIEANSIVSATATATVTVTYDSEEGLSFTPTYTITNRLTIQAKITDYDSIECYMASTDLRGKEVWVKCEEIVSSAVGYRMFDIVPPFGTAPTIMWVVTDASGGSTEWGYKKETLSSAYTIDSDFCVWNWTDDEKNPFAFVLQYRVEKLIQPDDIIDLPATKYVTTGREYPIFKYTKSISRTLDIEGSIMDDESDPHSTRADAEKLGIANHTIYRQPNGKWYQAAIQSVSFGREMKYTTVKIQQEAESR